MSLHTQHRLLIGIPALVYFVLSVVISVLPAYEIEKTQALKGIVELTTTEMAGRHLYLKEGCGVCHTQFVRDLQVDKPYGRGSVAGDYALEDPPLLGTQRTGPDLSNVGVRQPSQVWNLIHLYNPRAVVPTSVMPGYPWMFETKISAATDDVVVPVPDGFKPQGQVVIARQEAIELVRYLQLLQQVEVQ